MRSPVTVAATTGRRPDTLAGHAKRGECNAASLQPSRSRQRSPAPRRIPATLRTQPSLSPVAQNREPAAKPLHGSRAVEPAPPGHRHPLGLGIAHLPDPRHLPGPLALGRGARLRLARRHRDQGARRPHRRRAGALPGRERRRVGRLDPRRLPGLDRPGQGRLGAALRASQDPDGAVRHGHLRSERAGARDGREVGRLVPPLDGAVQPAADGRHPRLSRPAACWRSGPTSTG